jgi:lipid-binding SYLF domain-containing protein
MKKTKRVLLLALLPLVVGSFTSCSTQMRSRSELARDSAAALQKLYAGNKNARTLGQRAHSVLVFPTITRAGFGIGGESGNGTLFRKGHYGNLSVAQADGFYNTSAASYGLQAGAQQYGSALFMMSDADAAKLHQAGGWSLRAGPTFVVVDKGFDTALLNTKTMSRGTYGMTFNQKGVMGGLGLVGSKITRINPPGR